jgi:hypothetical protein
VLRPLLTPEEFEATRKACALTLAGRERVLAAWRAQKLETMIAARAAIEQSCDLMAWSDELLADALLKRRV